MVELLAQQAGVGLIGSGCVRTSERNARIGDLVADIAPDCVAHHGGGSLQIGQRRAFLHGLCGLFLLRLDDLNLDGLGRLGNDRALEAFGAFVRCGEGILGRGVLVGGLVDLLARSVVGRGLLFFHDLNFGRANEEPPDAEAHQGCDKAEGEEELDAAHEAVVAGREGRLSLNVLFFGAKGLALHVDVVGHRTVGVGLRAHVVGHGRRVKLRLFSKMWFLSFFITHDRLQG